MSAEYVRGSDTNTRGSLQTTAISGESVLAKRVVSKYESVFDNPGLLRQTEQTRKPLEYICEKGE
jgi:hypothetical protein